MTPNCPKECPARSNCQETENVERCLFYMQGHNISLSEALTKNRSTNKTVEDLKENGQDFEWYPTTQTMLEAIQADSKTQLYKNSEHINLNVLDCGAGDGRALNFLAGKGSKYAIEKSTILLAQQARDVIPVGTDFYQSTLIDKEVDLVFSNPPYSEYEQWAVKIIKEANAPLIYLIVPERWSRSESIKTALELREVKEAKVIYTGDFLDADRSARARINIIRIDTRYKRSHYSQNRLNVDPFDLWFAEAFPNPEELGEPSRHADEQILKDNLKQELVTGQNLIDILVTLYNRQLEKLRNNYTAALSLDPELMQELGIKSSELAKAVKQKIKGLKNLYWKELFLNYESITSRLTSKTRKKILDKLSANTSVDFNHENAYAVTMWVIRNANHYYDQQLVDLVEDMVRKANVILYTSNKRTFGDEDWRYDWYEQAPKELSHYQLELRIVLDRCGGINTSQWTWEREKYKGLTESAFNLLNDIVIVAANLGYQSLHRADSFFWESGKGNEFTLVKGGARIGSLMNVRAFKNGNIHIKFDQSFMRRLNIEFGRLKGWVKDWSEAAQEMDIPDEEAKQGFNSQFKLGNVTALLLTAENPNIHNEYAAAEAEDQLKARHTSAPVDDPIIFTAKKQDPTEEQTIIKLDEPEQQVKPNTTAKQMPPDPLILRGNHPSTDVMQWKLRF
ncbi:MAG: DUF4942 domain-containing protein [Thiothrix sp.]|nr:MAG: DUF4942 domain-containing protein [Thiothrix sp.]